MNYRNPGLYDAMGSDVSLAITVIVDRISIETENSDLNDETFFFARLQAEPELKQLPEYKQCFKILKSDPTFGEQLNLVVCMDHSTRLRPKNNGLPCISGIVEDLYN